MKNITEIKVNVIGGTETRYETRETEYNGEIGMKLKPEWKMTEVNVDHVESKSENALKFEGNWIPKSMIKELVWQSENAEMTARTVRRIVIPQWLAIKCGL